MDADTFQLYINKISVNFDNIPGMKKLAGRIGCKTGHLVLGLLAVIIFLTFFDVIGNLICDLLGVVYAGYLSFKAIETKETDDDKQWLTYWVLYSAMKLLETILDVILFWIPFYPTFKLIILLWLAYPDTRGAQQIYDSVIRPLLMAHEQEIDDTLADLKRQVDEARSIVDDKGIMP